MKLKKSQRIIAASILLLLIGGTVTYALLSRTDPNDPDQIERLVGRHYVLPEEEPTVATVEDVTKINSDFLKAAKNGDKLLIYKDAKKVLLYRPGIDKLIEVGPISVAPGVGAVGQ